MPLAISDTLHLTGKPSGNRGFLPYEDIPLDHYFVDGKDPEQQVDHVPQQEPTQTSKPDQGLKILQDFTAQQQKAIDAAAPVYDIDREKRLQRIGKAQKYTDAISVLGQIIAARSGASVAPMQMNNSSEASNIIMKLRDTYENDDRRHKLLSLQQQLRGSEMVSNELSRRQQVADADDRWTKQLTAQEIKEMNLLKERERIANDANSFENKLKKQKADADSRETDARIGYYNAGTNSRNAFADNETGSTTGKNGAAKTPYLSLYDDINSAPVFNIMDEGQARAIFNQILAKNPKAVELSKYRSYGTSESPSKAEIDAVISKYWKTVINVKPAEKPTWLPSQTGTQQQEYKPAARERKENTVKWLSDPANQTALDDFYSKVQTKYAGKISEQKAAMTTYLVKFAGMDVEAAKTFVDNQFAEIED